MLPPAPSVHPSMPLGSWPSGIVCRRDSGTHTGADGTPTLAPSTLAEDPMLPCSSWVRTDSTVVFPTKPCSCVTARIRTRSTRSCRVNSSSVGDFRRAGEPVHSSVRLSLRGPRLQLGTPAPANKHKLVPRVAVWDNAPLQLLPDGVTDRWAHHTCTMDDCQLH